MDPLVIVHVAVGAAVVALATAVGLWGVTRARALADATRPPGEARAFAHALQLTHTLVFAVGLLGVVLLLEQRAADDPLHARVYGPFMLLAILAAYGYRGDDRLLNVRVFALSALVIAALGARALVTG